MMKTAGGALRRRLLNHFGERAVYPAKGLDGTDAVRMVLSLDFLQQRLALRGDEIKVICGHFPLRSVEQIAGTCTTLTLLRDPVERTLSFLRQQREARMAVFLRQRQDEILRHARKPLTDIYDDFLGLGHVNNHMTRMLSMSPAGLGASLSAPVPVRRDHLTLAQQSLETIDAFGIQEDFESFCRDLEVQFDWDLGQRMVVNATAPAEAPAALRARIARDNELDVELYEFAQNLLKSRRAEGGSATSLD